MVDQTKLEESRERRKDVQTTKEALVTFRTEQKLVELVKKLKFNEKEIRDKEKYIAELKLTVNLRRLERVRSFNVLRVCEIFERFMMRENRR